MSTTIEKTIFPDLRKEQCIALTTFRRTGQAVTTPVWFAISLGTIYVETHADAGKLKRLYHTAHVTLAPCTYSGKVTGSVSEGNARILPESEESTAASAALSKKYGLMRSLFHFVRNARRMLQRKAKAGVVYIAIAPISG
ncbi:MAG TPA: PPOX class F420-dependent oxidoreductase [Ktedonobacteraceae bacterium]|nr:PPOX class F420-dependent oxidoreductase [Ktedonobacteraceae bacterium]